MDIVTDLMKLAGTGDNLSLISKSAGGDANAVQSALGMGLPLIMGSMATTAAKPGGADVLTKMMAQAGGTSPLDNMSGFLGGSAVSGGVIHGEYPFREPARAGPERYRPRRRDFPRQ